jgi:hypothetical protein
LSARRPVDLSVKVRTRRILRGDGRRVLGLWILRLRNCAIFCEILAHQPLKIIRDRPPESLGPDLHQALKAWRNVDHVAVSLRWHVAKKTPGTHSRKINLAFWCYTVQHRATRMKRVMVNLDDSTGLALENRAAGEKRSASNYIALLVETDLRAAGLLPETDQARAELFALAQEIGLPAALETLRRKARNTAQTAKPAA